MKQIYGLKQSAAYSAVFVLTFCIIQYFPITRKLSAEYSFRRHMNFMHVLHFEIMFDTRDENTRDKGIKKVLHYLRLKYLFKYFLYLKSFLKRKERKGENREY